MKLAKKSGRHAVAGRGRVGQIAYAALWVLLALVGFIAWPSQFGGQTGYTIVSGKSMEPTYHTGDLLITRPAAEYATGDVVVYKVPEGQPGAGYHVVHRIVGGNNETGFITRGDNNPSDDIWLPTSENIVGKVELLIGKGGFVLRQSRNPLLYALLGALLIGQILWPRDEDEDEDEKVAVAGLDSDELPEPVGAHLPAQREPERVMSESSAAGQLTADLDELTWLLGESSSELAEEMPTPALEDRRVLASLDAREQLAPALGLPVPVKAPVSTSARATLAEQLAAAVSSSPSGQVSVELLPDPVTGVLRYEIRAAASTSAPEVPGVATEGALIGLARQLD